MCVRAQYVSECRSLGVCDISGLQLDSAWYAVPLNSHQRAALSARMPLEPYRVYRACVELMERNGCVRCWLQRHCCVCRALPPLPPALLAPHRLVLLLHHQEFGRASNTGTLMLRQGHGGSSDGSSGGEYADASRRSADSPLAERVLASSPHFNADGVLLLVDGIPAHDAVLQQLCAADSEGLHTCVLFPSKDAVSVEERVQRARAAMVGAQPAGEAEVEAVAQTIIVVDGTYSQAAQMVRRIPRHIPRVKLTPHRETELEYQQYAQSVRRRMAERSEEAGVEDEEDAQSDVHRRGKQWSAADRRTSADTSASIEAAPLAAEVQVPLPTWDAASFSYLSSSFFSAVRKQPQGERVSTVEAIAYCLHSLRLLERAQQLSHESRPPATRPDRSDTASLTAFPGALLDSLLLLVDALRLQAGLYQQYRTHSRQRRRDIDAARREFYSRDECERRKAEQRQLTAAAAHTGGLCRAFNKQQGCDKSECKYAHRCGHCGSGDHSLVDCSREQTVAMEATGESANSPRQTVKRTSHAQGVT